MAAKPFCVVAVTLFLVGCTSAFVPMYGRRFSSQFPRLFQAACLVRNATTGEELQNEECSCGDETVACDVGPIAHYGMEMTFCNKLDDQEADQLYILQFACMSGEDPNCGPGTFCDIGPLNYEGTDYYLCRIASSVSPDADLMCKPDITFTQPPAWGQGRGRWAAAGQGNAGQYGPGMGWRWNTGNMGTGPANPPQNTWGPGMGAGRRWNTGMAGAGYNQQYPAGGAGTWGVGGGRGRGGQGRGGQGRGGQGRGGYRNW